MGAGDGSVSSAVDGSERGDGSGSIVAKLHNVLSCALLLISEIYLQLSSTDFQYFQ